MGQIEVFSPAKINLFLSVVGRMDNGFHELVSLVAPLDFGDELEVSARAGARSVTLSCSEASLPTDGRNLAVAAARRFLNDLRQDWEVSIRLEKRIPHGAGLGGGSSNAAATLTALAELAGREGIEVSRERLERLAGELGSDCPLFLAKKPVVMRGRGEKLEALGDSERARLSGRRVLLCKPSFSIGTPWAYGALASTAGSYDAADWAEMRLAGWRAGELELAALLSNSFERVAFAKYASFEPLLARLRELGAAVLMSGSGSCCFALVESEGLEVRLMEAIRDAWGPRCFVASCRVL